MKFSVLLPTRNRLELLKYALDSVLKQDYENWEVIIYDNYSDQDIQGYVQSKNDLRIKYFQTSKFVTVTENWNNALEKSSGDYVIMLGDDDCLMKGYFSKIIKLLEKFSDPDFIYVSSFLYAYPGVFPTMPDGFIQAFGNATFLHKKNSPFWLDKKEVMRCIKYTMNFKVMFGFNMQYSLMSRKLIDKLQSKGKFFQSPYPDYYATTSMMLTANRILVYPSPLVAIGISPKSFGYYYVNKKEKQGIEFLKNNAYSSLNHRLQKVILPGTDMNTSWLIAMETVKENFKESFPLRVNYGRYRFIQMVQVLQDWLLKIEGSKEQIKDLKNHLTWIEKILFNVALYVLSLFFCVFKKFPRQALSAKMSQWINLHMDFRCQTVEGKFQNISEVFENLDSSQVKQNP